MTANVESMFYTREKPWHGMGTMVMEAPTSAEALKLAGLDWTVEPKPIFTEIDSIFGKSMIEVPGFKANTRDIDGYVLGIVGSKYKIVQNVDAFAFTDNLIGGDVRYETAGSLGHGKRTWLLAKLPETEIVGDKLEQYLVFTNTFDGAGAIQVACTPIRVVCQNTLNLALRGARRNWSIRHTTNINERLIEAHHALKLSEAYIDALKANAEMLATKHLSNYEINRMIDELFPLSEKPSQAQVLHNMDRRSVFQKAMNADDLQNFKGTAWQFVNAAADMADHAQPLRQTQSGKETRLRNIFAGHPMFDKAYEMVMAV